MSRTTVFGLLLLALTVGTGVAVSTFGFAYGGRQSGPTYGPPTPAWEAELSFDVEGAFSTGPKETEVDVPVGEKFTLAVEMNRAPWDGYTSVQAAIQFPAAGLTIESVHNAEADPWPDCAVPLTSTTTPGAALVACLTGLIPPVPVSHYLGTIFEVTFACSNEESTNAVLMPVDTTPGALVFIDSSRQATISTQVVDGQKVADAITINCITPPTPTPRDVELSFDVQGAFSTGPKESAVDVPVGEKFTLAVEMNRVPSDGYVGVQAAIRYPTVGLTLESVHNAEGDPWPDCAVPLTATPEPDVAVLACLTALIPPLPVSQYLGNIFEVTFACSREESTNKVSMPVGTMHGALVDDDEPGIPYYELTTQVQDGQRVADAISINCVEPAEIRLEPAVPTVRLEDGEFEIGVWVGGVEHVAEFCGEGTCDRSEGLAVFLLALRFEPAIVTVTGAEAGPFLGSTGRLVQCVRLQPEDDLYRFECNTRDGLTPPGPQGSGLLALFRLLPAGQGCSPLDLEGELGGPLSENIPVEVFGGAVGVDDECRDLLPGTPTPQPPPNTPTPVPTGTPTPSPAPARACADVTGDGRVNHRDVVALALRLRIEDGGPGYEVRFDLNRDGRIDALDLRTITRQLGEQC